MKTRALGVLRSERLFHTRPATFLEHYLTSKRKRRWRTVSLSWRYARDLFEWTPFWPALALNRQDRRPR